MDFVGYLIIVFLFLLLVYFIYKYFYLQSRYFSLKKELNRQDLDYYLKKVKGMGYDFTIKSGSKASMQQSLNKGKEPDKRISSRKKSRSFKDLVK